MNIEDDYYFIKKMKGTGDYGSRWEAIRAIYGPKLDMGTSSSEIKYTAHDYSHHCVNIYTGIENLVVKRHSNELTPTELFILNVAVILHDYIMSTDTSRRNTHSEDGANYIMEKINSETGTELNQLLSNEEARMISYVVYGHGDIKSKDGSEINTLKEVTELYLNEYYRYPIKVPYLAAILRLADEFDCTVKRLTRPIQEIAFTDSKKDIESAKHYRKLQLIERIGIKVRPNNVLYLYCNDVVLDELRYEEDVQNVLEVREKIIKELNNVKNNVYLNMEQEYCPLKTYDDVEIVSRNLTFNNIIHDNLGKK